MTTNQRLVGLLTYCAYYHESQWDWRYRFLSTHVAKGNGMRVTALTCMSREARCYYNYLVERFEKK